MVLSNFLSRKKTDDSNPHKIIPISFSLRRVLHENYYKLDVMIETTKLETNKYMVQTRSQTKSSCVKLPEMHGIDKGLKSACKARKTEVSSNATYRQNVTY